MARKEITYIPSAEVCSKEIHIVLEDEVIEEVGFKKGCAGSLVERNEKGRSYPPIAGNLLWEKVNFLSRSVGSSVGKYGVIRA